MRNPARPSSAASTRSPYNPAQLMTQAARNRPREVRSVQSPSKRPPVTAQSRSNFAPLPSACSR